MKLPIKNAMLRKKIVYGGGLLLIVGFAFWARSNTFWLPHCLGDQFHYISLALKLDKLGFAHYNLRGVRIRFLNLDSEGKFQLVYPALAKDIHAQGDLLKALEMAGIYYYDQPFFHKPPAFPYALVLSHRLFSEKDQPYSVVATNIGRFLSKYKPFVFFSSQFYAVIVPLLFSLGLVVLAYILGGILFSSRVGLYAAFMMAIHPVAIMTAQKLLTDDMTAFFTVLSFIFYVVSYRNRNMILSFIAGVTCGVGVLTKQTAGYLLISLLIFSGIQISIKIFKGARSFKDFFDTQIILYACGVFLVSGFWFWTIYSKYGNPLWLPSQPDILQTDKSGWFREMSERPPGWILYLIGIPYLCPLFAVAWFSLYSGVKTVINSFKKKEFDYRIVLLWIVILTFAFMLRGVNNEHRRMLPVYPLITVLAGYCFDCFRSYTGKFSHFLGRKSARELLIIVLFVLCALWSVPIGVETGIFNKILIRKPF